MQYPFEPINLPATLEACGKLVGQLRGLVAQFGTLAAQFDKHPIGAAFLLCGAAMGVCAVAIICFRPRKAPPAQTE
ncbi:hypothetical protein [Cupriavidus sp. CuC1]|uniref:hypothetical protein n=1 Tax=Cupriavidus sp. CuC1 TaxID=3373131 RepID=UPI0037D4C841